MGEGAAAMEESAMLSIAEQGMAHHGPGQDALSHGHGTNSHGYGFRTSGDLDGWCST
jgi:hypothetical protein